MGSLSEYRQIVEASLVGAPFGHVARAVGIQAPAGTLEPGDSPRDGVVYRPALFSVRLPRTNSVTL